MAHNHLCHDCGAILYNCSWCIEQDNDHRTTGRCPECQKRLGVFWALELPFGGEVTIARSRYSGSDRYNEESRPIMMTVVSDYKELPHVTLDDIPSRASDGEYSGSSNQVWILTDAEYQYYIDIEAERAVAAEADAKAERIQTLRQSIINVWQMQDVKALPTADEARAMRKAYNDLHNEGGDGFIPRIVAKEDYDAMVTEYNDLTGEDITIEYDRRAYTASEALI